MILLQHSGHASYDVSARKKEQGADLVSDAGVHVASNRETHRKDTDARKT